MAIVGGIDDDDAIGAAFAVPHRNFGGNREREFRRRGDENWGDVRAATAMSRESNFVKVVGSIEEVLPRFIKSISAPRVRVGLKIGDMPRFFALRAPCGPGSRWEPLNPDPGMSCSRAWAGQPPDARL